MHSYVLLLTTEDKGRKEVHNILGEIIMAKNNLVGTRPTVIVSLALFIFLMGAAFFLGEEEVTPPAKPVAEEVVVSEAPEVSEWKSLCPEIPMVVFLTQPKVSRGRRRLLSMIAWGQMNPSFKNLFLSDFLRIP